MQPFDKIKNFINPEADDPAIDELMSDIAKFEVNTWVESLIDFLAFDPRKDEMLPPGLIDTWRELSPYKQEMAFLFLIGSVKALLEPPDEASVYIGT